MSHQQVMKKLRKEMRKDIQAKYKNFEAFLKEMGFWRRMQFCLARIFWP